MSIAAGIDYGILQESCPRYFLIAAGLIPSLGCGSTPGSSLAESMCMDGTSGWSMILLFVNVSPPPAIALTARGYRLVSSSVGRGPDALYVTDMLPFVLL